MKDGHVLFSRSSMMRHTHTIQYNSIPQYGDMKQFFSLFSTGNLADCYIRAQQIKYVDRASLAGVQRTFRE